MIQPPRRRILRFAAALASIAFIAFIVWIIHEANIGRDNALFKLVRATPYGDKIGHFFVSGLLALAAHFLCRGKIWRVAKIPIPIGPLFVLVALTLEEASQAYLPTRSFDVMDGLANAAGVIVFSLPLCFSRRERSPSG